jgi:threonine dehydrogenase-like Zn-dependent dehydrogenase
MAQKMKGVTLVADWVPRPDFVLGSKDIEGKQTYLGSKVWKNPKMEIRDYEIPEPGEEEVLIEVKVCGICGSDVHMAEADKDGYILYPGLTGFPAIMGHELSGVVVRAGRNARNKRTNKPFVAGEEVTVEEMLWCGQCKPCADGYPNQCEQLDEIGFNVNGAYTKYLVVPSRVVWSLAPLKRKYSGIDLFLAGSLVEPTSVAYNAVIECGGGIRPGDNVVICGSGPIGLGATAILKKAGAARVILSETVKERRDMGARMGADFLINPQKEDFTEKVLEYTDGMGANLYVEATGLPTLVYPTIEQVIWRGKTIGCTVVIVARADAKIPVTGEVFQVKKSRIVGAQGHSGYGTFPRVIECMAAGMDMTPLITKKIKLGQIPENIVQLRTNRTDCKITYVAD